MSVTGRRSNGDSVEEQQRRAEETKTALTGLQQREQDDPRDKTELLEELSKSDLKDEIDDKALRFLASKDIPTSNMSEEDVQEFKNYLDVLLMRKRAHYPDENQALTGVLREVAHDDPDAGLQPIDKGDLLADEAFAQSMKARVLKAKNGGLISKVLSSIRVSKVSRGEDSGGDRLLSRWRS